MNENEYGQYAGGPFDHHQVPHGMTGDPLWRRLIRISIVSRQGSLRQTLGLPLGILSAWHEHHVVLSETVVCFALC